LQYEEDNAHCCAGEPGMLPLQIDRNLHACVPDCPQNP
jgi:hypothetical protein